MLDCLVVCILNGCLCHWLIVCTIVCDVPWVISRHTLLSSNSSLVAICLWLFPHWEWRWTVLRCQPYNSNPSILCHFFSEIQNISLLTSVYRNHIRVELRLAFSTSHGEWYKDTKNNFQIYRPINNTFVIDTFYKALMHWNQFHWYILAISDMLGNGYFWGKWPFWGIKGEPVHDAFLCLINLPISLCF